MIYILKIPLLFYNNNISFAVAPSSAFMLKMNYLHWVQWYTQSWISPGYKLLLWKWCHESKHRLNFIHSVNLDLEEERKKWSNILVFYHCQHHTSYWNISFIYFFNNDLFIIDFLVRCLISSTLKERKNEWSNILVFYHCHHHILVTDIYFLYLSTTIFR